MGVRTDYESRVLEVENTRSPKTDINGAQPLLIKQEEKRGATQKLDLSWLNVRPGRIARTTEPNRKDSPMSSPCVGAPRMTCEDYDGILLGAGHNSLILQAYLGAAGLKTLCLERRDVPGGGLTTIEGPNHPGFLHNTHSFFHRALNQMPWYRDLDLQRHGAIYLEPELNVALLLRSGEALEWWTDFERTMESFARFSRKDAETIRRWREAFLPIVQNILVPESQSPPLPPDQR